MSRTSRLLVALTLALAGVVAHRGGYWSGLTLAAFTVAVLAGAWAQRADHRADRVVVVQAVLAMAIIGTVLAERRPMWLDIVLVCAVLLAPGARGGTAQLVVVCTLPLVGFMALDHPAAAGRLTIGAWAVAALGALGSLSFEHRAGVLGAAAGPGVDPAAARRARARHLREVGVAALAVLLLAPLVAGAVGADDGEGGRDRRGPAASADLRPATFDGYLNLGDRSDLGDTPLLRVTADAGDFWRAGSLDTYDGRTWTRTVDAEAVGATGATHLPASAALAAVPAQDGEGTLDPAVARQPLTQRIEVLAGSFTTLVGAHPLSQVAAPVSALVSSDGTATVSPALRAGDVYDVVSDRPLVTAEILRAHDPRTDPAAIPAAIAARDLALPAVPARVLDLARQIADGQPTTYDVVVALEAWMAEHTEYTLDIPPLPDGADAVDQFLFVDRRGFCSQIGSALTVMLRAVGVPARLAVGFVPGERSGGADGPADWLVRASDYHAWVEVWFPGVGWQPFDPTADVALAGDASATVASSPSDGGTGVPTTLVLAGIAVVVVAAAALVAVAVRRRRRVAPATVRWDHDAAGRLATAGARLGRPRRTDETLVDYARALAEHTGDGRLPVVAELVSRAAYHRDGITDDARTWVDDLLTDLQREPVDA